MVKVLTIIENTGDREKIKRFLKKPEYDVFSADNHKEGLELAKEILPDVILCTANFSGVPCYEIKEKLNSSLNTALVAFIPIIDNSEINDFRMWMSLGTDDFLLKPITEKNILEIIQARLKKKNLFKEYFRNESEVLSDSKNKEESYSEHILLTANGKSHFVKINDIICIKAEREYSKVFLSNGNKITICRSLKKWEKMLPQKSFIRVHRSTILNLHFIENIVKGYNRSFNIQLKNLKEPLIVSKRYASKLKDIISL